MELKEIIAAFEAALDKRFNEQTIGAVVDARLKELLKPLNKKDVQIGDLAVDRPKGVTWSQWLGDLKRIGHGEAPMWVKEPQASFIKGISNIDPAFIASLGPAQRKSLFEATDASGGYLVPTEEMNRLLDLTTGFSVVPALCTAVPMRTNMITFPTLTSGLTAYWIPEAQSSSPSGQSEGVKQESTPTFSQMTITAHTLAVLVYVSNQLLDDSDPAIDQVLFQIFRKTLDKYFDLACLRGAGTTTDPVSGLNSLITTNVLTAGAIMDYDDVIDLIYSCLDNADGATSQIDIVGHTKAERVLLKVKDQDGAYVYKRPSEARGVATLWGEPWHRDNNIPTTLGTGTNTNQIFAGDFANYAYVGQRNQMIIKANPWGTGFTQNQTAFLAEFRRGFAVSKESVFSVCNGVPNQ